MSNKNRIYWVYWIVLTVGMTGYLIMQLTGEDKTVYLPGKTSHGHYQIEMACSACHTDPLGGGEVLQDACMGCHGEELERADDSHPKSKFTNPRNADRVAKLDARKCITCHTEHREEITLEMGVSLPNDFCFKCHEDVAENRPSHVGMEFNTCASAGCHNFHDNRGLYEDFLAKHLDEPAYLKKASVKPLSAGKAYELINSYPVAAYPIKSLTINDADTPADVRNDPKVMQDWLASSHSKAGVNCTACHMQSSAETKEKIWKEKPGYQVCESCHESQVKGFLASRHGMRLAQDLSAMTPGQARLDMKKNAHDRELSCTSCHGSHQFDKKHAAVDGCLACHDDKHSNQYKQSKHFTLWHKEVTGQAEANTGVSCATCHLPRKQSRHENGTFVSSEHNQNDNLRPNEKMLRSVCMQCHGLEFSIDSLADRKLIEKNFSSKPDVHIKSLDLVRQRKDLKKDIEGM